MNHEHDFPRQHPALDRALRDQIKAPKMDVAFRQQVFARIVAQRATLARAAQSPDVARSRLRVQLLLQLLNVGAIGLAGVLLFGALGERLQHGGLLLAVALAGAALGYGLHRARLLGWVRALEF